MLFYVKNIYTTTLIFIITIKNIKKVIGNVAIIYSLYEKKINVFLDINFCNSY